MSKVDFVRELSGYTGSACLVKREDQFFVVSSTTVFGVPETLVFPGDKNGKVTDWGEVAGGKYCSRDEAISELESQS